MINEVNADFPFEQNATLDSIEEGMRFLEDNVKVSLALLAVSLGRIKRDQLYLDIAPDFKTYISLERTNLKYGKALHLSVVGENWFKHRQSLKDNRLKLSECMSKMSLIDDEIANNDPMFFKKFREYSVRQLKEYIRARKVNSNVFATVDLSASVSVNGAYLELGETKVRGINLNEVKKNTMAGKRAVVIWVDDELEAKRIRRKFL